MGKPKISSDEFLNDNKQERFFCNECGEKLLEDDNFCPNCGKNFDDNDNSNEKSKKFIIGAIALVTIILIGGYFGYSAYQTSEFDKNLKDAMINDGKVQYCIDKGFNSINTGARGVGGPIGEGTLMAAEPFVLNESKNLEKCNKFAQTPEEKKLAQLLIERNILRSEFVNTSIGYASVVSDVQLDFIGTNTESNYNSGYSLINKGSEIENKIAVKDGEILELLNKYSDLKKRWDNIKSNE